jgi:predicted lipopolysaccharide heptosyltransferase III
VTPRRVLLTRLRFIGDVVLTTPLIRSVRNAYPDAFIAYCAERAAASLLEGNPALNEIIPYDYGSPSWREQLRVGRLLRRHRFDLVIDLFGNPRSAVLCLLSGASVRVGPARRGRGRFYTHRVADDGAPKTAIGFHNLSLAAAGIPPTATATELFLTHGERGAAAQLLREQCGKGPIVAVHPGATWPAKHWFPDRFAALIDRLAAAGLRTVVLAGPRDGTTVEGVRRAARTELTVLAGLPLRTMAAVLSHCAVFVGNDAGPMHISAAVGTPTIGLFGPGEDDIWFPYDPAAGHTALRRPVPCHPCHLDFCNREGEGYMECMKRLEVEEVAAAALASARRGTSRVPPPV